MANNRFNKQVSPKGYADGGPAGTGKGAPPFKGPRKPKAGRGSKKTKLKDLKPIIIDLSKNKDGSNIFKVKK